MSKQISTHTPSPCGHSSSFKAEDNGIGELFRKHGESYISTRKLPKQHIKLIRSIRMCRTPSLGGVVYECKNCGNKKYVYKSCGNSQCPKCQGIKRMQWQDKLANKMLQCPYVHLTFTLPSELRSLARRNQKEMYNMLMRTAWKSIKTTCADSKNLGALPGAIMVLHTFGSDLKYHVHVHVLVTFGGIDANGNWLWPKRRDKLVPFREIRRKYRTLFLKALEKDYHELDTTLDFQVLKKDLEKKSWCVNSQRPVSDPTHLREYLGRYICRIGLSKSRFLYDSKNQKVHLKFKDYRNRDKSTELIPQKTRSL